MHPSIALQTTLVTHLSSALQNYINCTHLLFSLLLLFIERAPAVVVRVHPTVCRNGGGL